MENRNDEKEFFFFSIQQPMREHFQGPAPDAEFKFFHRERLLRHESDGLLDLGLKAARQFRVDFAVVRFFTAEIFTRRR